MPKSKKKFINKKNAVTFHVVHRSQQDPLIADETAPQHVLVQTNTEKREDKIDFKKRKEEQQKYGIFFDDDYNYLQHLRGGTEMVNDWVPSYRTTKREDFPPLKGQEAASTEPAVKIQLPSSVFASSVEEDVGLLNKAAPRSGLCLDLDPDVVAAMDEDFDFDDPNNELEDNFMELANAEGNLEEEESTSSGDVSEEEYEGEINDDVPSLKDSECTFEEEETKSRFTNYSMSSSIMRRNNQLSLLDDRFEQLFAEYDDSEIGALHNEEIEGYVAPDSDLIQQCIEDFEKQKATQKHETDRTMKEVTLTENLYSDSDNETDCFVVPDKTEKWDCESVLSTYSNLYNHPKLITEPERIRVSDRTGIPLDVFDGAGNKLTARSLAKLDAANNEMNRQRRAESIISMLSSLSIRPKNETCEAKRDRKKAIKEYRKERRMERKLNSEAFKEEKKRQEKILLNNRYNLQGIKIV